MRVRLTRLSNHGNALRTDSVEGELIHGPVVGDPMQVWGEPLDPEMDVRLVTTSRVVYIDGENVHTENTHYLLEVLP